MIITCPECAAQFLVNRSEFGTRTRKVRCSNCGYAWHQPVVEGPTLRSPDARPTDRVYETPSENDVDDKSETAQLLEDSRAEKTKPAKSAMESVLDSANFASSTTDGDTSADSGAAPEEADTEDLTLAETDASETETSGAEESIDFAVEEPNPAESETVKATEEQAPDVDDGKKQGTQPSASESDTVTAFGQSSPKAQWRRWAIPASAAAAVLLVIGGLIFARDGIIHMLPGAASAYEAVGLSGQPVAGAGLEFHQVTSRREWSGPEEVLIVHGKIANVTKAKIPVPLVRVALYDIDDSEVQAVTVANTLPTIAPGEEIPFEARIPSPAISAQRIRVNFDALEAEHHGHDAS
ncbi:MAG: zinc-ribbon domain-containing protein [Hyphomicrobiales bacterium]|nr:zinc-ribbon domain-containing protein [Hyphomicrobiales bacterium]